MALGVQALPNQWHAVLTATFRFGTSTQIEIDDASGIPASPTAPLVALIWDDTHWCLSKFTGKSSNILTGLSAAKAKNCDADISSYDFAVGANVEIVLSADMLDQLIAELQTWTVARNAGGFGLTALGLLALSDPTELAIDSDAITITGSVHKLQPQSGNADNLATINGPAGSRLLFLRATDSNDVLTLTETGNILIEGGTTLILPYEGYLLLIYDDVADKWRVFGTVFDATAPAAIGTAAAGTANVAARRDHVHALTALANDLTIGDYGLLVNSSPAADKWSGPTDSQTAGENVALGDLCYMKSDGKLWKAKADASSTVPALWMATATISANAAGVFLKPGGVIHLHTKAPGWTIGALIYLSGATAGAMVTTAVSTSGYYSQVIGVAGPANDILVFEPSAAMAVKA